MVSSLSALQKSNRRIAKRHGISTLTLSRQIDRLSDPVKGEPVPLEASGAHLEDAETLTIAPQSTWAFRGAVESGAVVAITGHSTAYATTAKATVDGKSPGTLALAITPGLEAALDGAEVVTLTEAGTVEYDAHQTTDREAASRGWEVPSGSVMLVALMDGGERAPEVGDIASGAVAGTVLQREVVPSVRAVLQVGVPS